MPVTSIRTCGHVVPAGQRCHCRPSTAERGYGGAWAALSAYVIATEMSCWRCGRTESPCGGTWTADHVIPLDDGGLTVRENLRKACRSCNSARERASRRR